MAGRFAIPAHVGQFESRQALPSWEGRQLQQPYPELEELSYRCHFEDATQARSPNQSSCSASTLLPVRLGWN